MNSISQSISLTPLNNNNKDADASKITNNTYGQRSRQSSHTRSSSSSSASSISRSLTKVNKPGMINHHKQNTISSVTSNKVETMIPQLNSNNNNNHNHDNNDKLCHQGSNSPVTTGTRESIASGGGYFTGDDDSISIGGSSEQVVRLSSHSNNFINDNNHNYIDDVHSSNVAIICNDNHKNTTNEQKSIDFTVKQNVHSSNVINILNKNNPVTKTQYVTM